MNMAAFAKCHPGPSLKSCLSPGALHGHAPMSTGDVLAIQCASGCDCASSTARGLPIFSVHLSTGSLSTKAKLGAVRQPWWQGTEQRSALGLLPPIKRAFPKYLHPLRSHRSQNCRPSLFAVQCSAGDRGDQGTKVDDGIPNNNDDGSQSLEDEIARPTNQVASALVTDRAEASKSGSLYGAQHAENTKASESEKPNVVSPQRLGQTGSQWDSTSLSRLAAGLTLAVGLGLAALVGKKSFSRHIALPGGGTPVQAASVLPNTPLAGTEARWHAYVEERHVEEQLDGPLEKGCRELFAGMEDMDIGLGGEGLRSTDHMQAALLDATRLAQGWVDKNILKSNLVQDTEGLSLHQDRMEFEHLAAQAGDDGVASAGGSLSETIEESSEGGDDAAQEYRRLSKPRPLTVKLRIVSLRGSVPPLWVREFFTVQGKNAKLSVESKGDLSSIMDELTAALRSKKVLPKSAMAADLVTVGDSWLPHAIASGAVSPMRGAERSEWFQRLSPTWQALLRRDEKGQMDPHGAVYAAPYRWGATLIAYREDELAKHKIAPITSWADLWRPELAGKVAIVDSPREVVGATLRSLGASANVKSFDAEVPGGREAVAKQFTALQRQVKLYDNIHYLKALAAGDVWVAVGWSTDLLPFARRSSHVTVVAPREGTSLWADLWAVPATTRFTTGKVGGRIRGPSPLVSQWVDFCLQPARAGAFQQEIFVGAPPSQLPWLKRSQEVRPDGDTYRFHLEANATSMAVAQGPEKDQAWHEDKGQATVGRTVEVGQTGEGKEFESKAADKAMNGKPATDKETETNLVKGVPVLSVLSRSEFLEPLSESALEDYRWLMTQRVKEADNGLRGRIEKLIDVVTHRLNKQPPPS